MKPPYKDTGEHYEVRGYWGFLILMMVKEPFAVFRPAMFAMGGWALGTIMGFASTMEMSEKGREAQIYILLIMLVISTILVLDNALRMWKRALDTGLAVRVRKP